ncbi:DNA-binding protein [Dawidia soli]|uniref:DNA-binding protein n=1 Tax=Dawidia soli TaxID=2782352 RepID=A0AAP2DFK0_9BACT|nr:DNA-binding protein [Dawidia soli]MBT1689865.1 DNA-binding protein [Dawidia soli]
MKREATKGILMNRKQAAIYVKTLFPKWDTTAAVMAVWDSIKRYDFKPFKIGGRVHYYKHNIDKGFEVRLDR